MQMFKYNSICYNLKNTSSKSTIKALEQGAKYVHS